MIKLHVVTRLRRSYCTRSHWWNRTKLHIAGRTLAQLHDYGMTSREKRVGGVEWALLDRRICGRICAWGICYHTTQICAQGIFFLWITEDSHLYILLRWVQPKFDCYKSYKGASLREEMYWRHDIACAFWLGYENLWVQWVKSSAILWTVKLEGSDSLREMALRDLQIFHSMVSREVVQMSKSSLRE